MDNRGKFSILVVDDEKSNLDVLNHILKSEYTVYIAKSGGVAVKRARADKPDLILLDIIMPDISGYDVFLELKSYEETMNIPVIFITGLSSVADEEKGFILGAVDYITKPFNNSIVRARVKTHIQIIKQMRTIEKLGMVDHLTELPNRRFFESALETEWSKAIRTGTALSILTMDVDKFKLYNDTHGHKQGDVLLQTISAVFMAALDQPTFSVARVGGEEFIAILPETEAERALEIAETLRLNVEETAPATICIGVATQSPTINDSLKDLIARSDRAMYAAKNSGRNKVCVEE